MKKPILVDANAKDVLYTFHFEAGPSVWASSGQHTTARDGIRIDLLQGDVDPLGLA